ncbi:hypothetical protein ABENE_16455 [Asticcacaulis benevestitus DSM 16100 = ATCC BAA-896]|uniref:Outer membrane protein beta-barrel domain-containing protein n=2 Tax=Asticcacaulis TaxID=76890 RepID=V4PRJ6_9CAUL|nr:hypothetical protein ABENE_16455 [Asticcacaulis benevestitus DSM 16100 = ATCC BAA-896]
MFIVPPTAFGQTPTPPADKPAPTESTTVVVKGAKRAVTNKIDRRVYNVSNSPHSGFATLNDVLSRIPSVTIDPHGAIALRGNTQVKVLIDGHAANPAVLRNLTPAQIDRIEIVTNPSAQFDSEGAGGVINIILKKKRPDGLNGSVNVRSDGDGRFNLDASAAYKIGKWSIAAAAGTNQTRERSREDGDQSWFSDGGGTETSHGSEVSDMVRRQSYANLQIDDQITDLDKISVKISANNAWKMVKDSATSRKIDSDGHVVENYTDAGIDPSQEFVTEFEATYEHVGKADGEQLTMNLIRTHTESPETTIHTYSFDLPARPDLTYLQTVKAPEAETAFTVDYERPLKNGSSLKTGFSFDDRDKRLWRTTQGLSELVPGQADQTAFLRFTARSAAAYVTYQMQFGKWGIMPGLRIESNQWDVNLVSSNFDAGRDYVRWLPSLHVNRFLTDQLKLVASYSHRTQKPMPWVLDPSTVYYSKQFAHVGNPYLKPQDTDSFETGYEYESGKFSSNGTLYYRKSYNTIVPARTFTDDQIIIASSVNATHSTAAGGEFTAKGDVTKHLQYSFNLNVFDNDVVGITGGQMLRRAGVTYSGNAVLEYTPTTKDWLQLTYSAAGKTLALQGYTTGFDRLDFAYRHRFNPQWAFAVRGFDLLNSSKQQRLFVTPDGETQSVTRTQRPGLMMSLIYKFGHGS